MEEEETKGRKKEEEEEEEEEGKEETLTVKRLNELSAPIYVSSSKIATLVIQFAL